MRARAAGGGNSGGLEIWQAWSAGSHLAEHKGKGQRAFEQRDDADALRGAEALARDLAQQIDAAVRYGRTERQQKPLPRHHMSRWDTRMRAASVSGIGVSCIGRAQV